MPVTADPTLVIDWLGDGAFGGDGSIDALYPYTIDGLGTMTIDDLATLLTLEDATADLRLNPEVFIGRGRDQARQYSPPRAGVMEFSLDNPTGKYSSANAASPLAGQLLPGRLTDFKETYLGVDYPLFRGFLEDPRELPSDTQRMVHWTAVDGLAWLRAAKVSTAMYTSVRTDQTIGYVLDAVGWPASLRVLDTGKTTLARWWVDGISAFDAIRDIVLSEGQGALFYVDAEGNLTFESRHYRLLTTRCVTVQATFRGAGAEPLYGQDFEYENGIRQVVNICTIPVRSYAVGSLGTIWTGPTPITFGPSETKTYTVSTTADGFTGALDPTTGGGDYTVTAGSITSATLNRSGGKTATLTVVAGSGGATITGLRVRGQTVTISTEDWSHTVDTSASQNPNSGYGPRAFPDEFIPKWVPTSQEAVDYCNSVVQRYQQPVPRCRISVSNLTAERLIQALSRKISDRIHVTEAERAFVDDDFMIETITHEVSDGRNHKARFTCERVAAAQAFWILGDAVLGLLGQSTVVGY